MPVDVLRENDEIVRALQASLREGGQALNAVPPLLKRVILENRWQERRVDVVQRTAAYHDFRRFIEDGRPDGLGADLKIIKRLCSDDREAIDLLDKATPGRQGDRNDLVDNVNDVAASGPDGNAAQAAIRRLRKDRPDLHADVMAGKISPHGAMVAAGFRPKTWTAPADPAALARAIRRRLAPAEVAALIEELGAD